MKHPRIAEIGNNQQDYQLYQLGDDDFLEEMSMKLGYEITYGDFYSSPIHRLNLILSEAMVKDLISSPDEIRDGIISYIIDSLISEMEEACVELKDFWEIRLMKSEKDDYYKCLIRGNFNHVEK